MSVLTGEFLRSVSYGFDYKNEKWKMAIPG